jgi:hypothetical protein
MLSQIMIGQRRRAICYFAMNRWSFPVRMQVFRGALIWRSIVNACILLSMVLLGSCDRDPFLRNRRVVKGDYLLEYFPDGDCYYLAKRGKEVQGGVFQGIIQQIGWSEEYIVCSVKKQYRGDVDGIYSVALHSGVIDGPLARDFAKDPRFRGVTLTEVGAAYARLR